MSTPIRVTGYTTSHIYVYVTPVYVTLHGEYTRKYGDVYGTVLREM